MLYSVLNKYHLICSSSDNFEIKIWKINNNFIFFVSNTINSYWTYNLRIKLYDNNDIDNIIIDLGCSWEKNIYVKTFIELDDLNLPKIKLNLINITDINNNIPFKCVNIYEPNLIKILNRCVIDNNNIMLSIKNISLFYFNEKQIMILLDGYNLKSECIKLNFFGLDNNYEKIEININSNDQIIRYIYTPSNIPIETNNYKLMYKLTKLNPICTNLPVQNEYRLIYSDIISDNIVYSCNVYYVNNNLINIDLRSSLPLIKSNKSLILFSDMSFFKIIIRIYDIGSNMSESKDIELNTHNNMSIFVNTDFQIIPNMSHNNFTISCIIDEKSFNYRQYNNLMSIIHTNPNCLIKIFDNNNIKKYISENYDASISQLYDKIYITDYKNKFFTYAYLYKSTNDNQNLSIYIDINFFSVNSLNNILLDINKQSDILVNLNDYLIISSKLNKTVKSLLNELYDGLIKNNYNLTNNINKPNKQYELLNINHITNDIVDSNNNILFIHNTNNQNNYFDNYQQINTINLLYTKTHTDGLNDIYYLSNNEYEFIVMNNDIIINNISNLTNEIDEDLNINISNRITNITRQLNIRKSNDKIKIIKIN
jgi:hypothetical protein